VVGSGCGDDMTGAAGVSPALPWCPCLRFGSWCVSWVGAFALPSATGLGVTGDASETATTPAVRATIGPAADSSACFFP
jgi:hypothetical protein